MIGTNFDDFMTAVLDLLPDAEVGEDNDGQVVVYTGLRVLKGGDVLVPFEDEPDVCGEPNCEDCKPQPEPTTMYPVKCVGCKRVYVLEMTYEQWIKWTGPRELRPLVQVLFPDYTADQRQLLLSQTCGPCYDALFPPEAYEPDEDI